MNSEVVGPPGGEDPFEKEKVAAMRAVVVEVDPQAKEVDDYTLTRFLRARDLDIDKASTMFLKYLKWKKASVPNGFISDIEVKNELAQKKMFMQGYDKKGRPIGVAVVAKFYCSKGGMDEFKRFVVYILDKVCNRTRHPRQKEEGDLIKESSTLVREVVTNCTPRDQNKFLCIADLQGWGYSNCDIRAYLAGLDILQNYYPEKLGKVLLIHVPYIFMKAWKIICPFIDKRTKEKFVFVDDKILKATLLEEIDESQLPEIYGGQLQLVSIGPTED